MRRKPKVFESIFILKGLCNSIKIWLVATKATVTQPFLTNTPAKSAKVYAHGA